MNKARRKMFQSQYDRYIFGILAAVEVLMSFTFLGYVHIPPISITYAYIPILLAGVFLGPLSAMSIGIVFGICSMYKASAYYVMEGDQIFSPSMSGAPLESLLLSVGTRAVFGLLVGLLFCWAKKRRYPALFLGVAAACCRRLHSIIVYTAMGILFPEQGNDLASALTGLPDPGDILLVIMCVLVVDLSWKANCSEWAKKFRAYVELEHKQLWKHLDGGKSKALIAVFAILAIFPSIASLIYFSQRISYVMSVYGLESAKMLNYDLMHLQVQFFMAVLALIVILCLLFWAAYRYLSYREYLGQMDVLTGSMGRRMFLDYCEHLFADNAQTEKSGCFLVIDVDWFKEINDKLGHPAGDAVLRKTAEDLAEIFSEYGQIGRLGGDEFAVVLDSFVPVNRLQELLEQFQERVSDILQAPERVTCSIGAQIFRYTQNLEEVYAEADKLLYQAKERGRAQYVIGTEKERIYQENNSLPS